MTLNDLLDAGITFESEVAIVYYDYDKEVRAYVDWAKNPGLYRACCNSEIRCIYVDKKPYTEKQVLHIEVEKPKL